MSCFSNFPEVQYDYECGHMTTNVGIGPNRSPADSLCGAKASETTDSQVTTDSTVASLVAANFVVDWQFRKNLQKPMFAQVVFCLRGPGDGNPGAQVGSKLEGCWLMLARLGSVLDHLGAIWGQVGAKLAQVGRNLAQESPKWQ